MNQHFGTTVNVLVPRRMTSRADCERTLRALCACGMLAPEYFDVVEPIREPFDCDNIDAVIDAVWQWQRGPDTFMWRRRKPKSWGGIYMSKTPEPEHGKVDLEATAGHAEVNADLIRFLQTSAVALGADFGLLDASPLKQDGTESCLAITTRELSNGLPDLYWGMVFGKPYIELFGAQRLAQTPVARCEEVAPGTFYLQLTDSLEDVRARPALVDQVRAEAKRFLGIEAFAHDETALPHRRIPRFTLSQ